MAKILIAQAPTDERTRLVMALQMAGHEPAEAENGATAIEMHMSGQYDLAVIDDELPDMFGSDLVLRLRKVRGFNLPAVLLLPSCAADAQPAESESPMPPDVPAIYRVVKPASCGEIQAAVELALADGGEADRHVSLEQRREMWGDIATLQRLARSAT